MNDQVVETKMNEESPGVKSSKRTWGGIMILAGIAVLCILAGVSFFIKAADPSTIKDCGLALIVTGGALLGVTVLEGIGKKIADVNAASKVEG